MTYKQILIFKNFFQLSYNYTYIIRILFYKIITNILMSGSIIHIIYFIFL